jgi:hypothetical protein
MTRRSKKCLKKFLENQKTCMHTLASGIDVGQGINVGPGEFGKKNKLGP